MDPQVIAAVVASPTALIAATAAYMAGRHQARSAHLGPVDAVRRQHQRDAYAAFLHAAETYAYGTRRTVSLAHARTEIANAEGIADRAGVEERAVVLRAEAAERDDALRATLPVVQLEGPEHVADLAKEVASAAFQIRLAARQRDYSDAASVQAARDEHEHLTEVIAAYVTAARDHLNGHNAGL
ncbi:hypothetical protein [Streptomyces sp. TRM75563]|uniref:hypothetical protein n=1 Tax=Streptomyces sp. TRM75563 TaxID=2817418 RepID=UPI001F620047|nr:hypothetical protein [Streptomyces sp. TRM75563]MCI4041777.1 hypothetical protein [Streptomyces sp. TRM75563]